MEHFVRFPGALEDDRIQFYGVFLRLLLIHVKSRNGLVSLWFQIAAIGDEEAKRM